MVAVASGGHAACPTRAPTTDRQRGSGTVGSAWQWVTIGILMTLSHVAQGDLIEHAMDKDREAAAKGKGFSWEVRPEIVAELATLPDIPKKLHIFWPDAGVVNSPDPMVQHGIRKMIDLNPDWTWKVYEHKDIGDYIRAELDRAHPVLSKEDVEMMMKAHIVEQTDVARLLIMWHEGGFYQDVDRIYNVPMSHVLEPGVKMVLQTLYNGNFMQDQMCSAPGNPVVMQAINVSWNMRRRIPRVDGLASFMDHMMMVNSWTVAITRSLFGSDTIDMKSAREAIAKVPYLKTNDEEWCDGLWITPYEECKSITRAGLYETYGIHPWGFEVKQKWLDRCQSIRAMPKTSEDDNDERTRLLNLYQCYVDFHKLPATTTQDPRLVAERVASSCRGFYIQNNTDVSGAEWVSDQPAAGYQMNARVCCGLCGSKSECKAWVTQPSTNQCWLMKASTVDGISFRDASDRITGIKADALSAAEVAKQEKVAAVQPVAVSENTNPEVDPALIPKLKALAPIPKKLHIIFPDKNVVDSSDDMVLHGVRKMIELNPDWNYTVYDHDAVDAYIRKELTRDEPMLSPRDVNLVLQAHIVERTDAARLLMMWHEGGFYQDVDRVYNVPMKVVLTPEVKMVIPTLYNNNFMQDLMCTAPYNPVVRRAIDVAWEIRRRVPRVNGIANFRDHMDMVNSWSLAITLELFGAAHVSIAKARQAIEKVPQLKTYNEEWCDGLWIRPFPACKSVSRVQLYETYNIQPWGAVVKGIWKQKCTQITERLEKLVHMQKQKITHPKLRGVAMSRLRADYAKYTCSDDDHRPDNFKAELLEVPVG
eukprot:m.64733 g.64733  ORF g.64733 m.64733 type:complete len:817 (-) comp8243_c0_seq2:174-2624(-)